MTWCKLRMISVLLNSSLHERVVYSWVNSTYLVNFEEKTKPVMETSHCPSFATCPLCASVGLCQISPSNFKEKSENGSSLPLAFLKKVLPSLWVNVNSCNDPWKTTFKLKRIYLRSYYDPLHRSHCQRAFQSSEQKPLLTFEVMVLFPDIFERTELSVSLITSRLQTRQASTNYQFAVIPKSKLAVNQREGVLNAVQDWEELWFTSV